MGLLFMLMIGNILILYFILFYLTLIQENENPLQVTLEVPTKKLTFRARTSSFLSGLDKDLGTFIFKKRDEKNRCA